MKTLFVFKIDNVIDVITNSSSELFVLKAETESILEEMLLNAYPDYPTEYYQPTLIKDISIEDLRTYMEYAHRDSDFILSGYKHDDMYETSYGYSFVKKEFLIDKEQEIKKELDPQNCTWLLFSKSDNPKYEHQEKLSEIGARYHLG